jgi:hypothetical protein
MLLVCERFLLLGVVVVVVVVMVVALVLGTLWPLVLFVLAALLLLLGRGLVLVMPCRRTFAGASCPCRV